MATTAFAHRVVHRPAAAVLRDLPHALEVPGCRLRIGRQPQPAAEARGNRLPLSWESPRGDGAGFLEVTELSPRATQVDVGLDGWVPRRAGVQAADAVARAVREKLEGRGAQPRPAPRAAPPHRRVQRIAVAAAVVVLLALGVAWLPRPTPVSLETAVERYAAVSAAPADSADRDLDPGLASVPPATPASPPPLAAEPPPTDDVAQEQDVPAEEASGADGGASTADEGAEPADAAPSPEPAGASAARGPTPGVYRYATSGWEEISAPGSRRSFPEETTQTVHSTACGHTSHWTPFEERADELAFCYDGDHQVLAGIRGHREFYRFRVEQDFTCTITAHDGAGGWSARCPGDDTVVHVQTRVVGPAQVEVAGRAVPARQLEITSRFEGATTGTRHARSWVGEDGLLLRTQVEAELQTDGPFGRMTYREQHRLDLLDVTPQR